ncbi:hypothetical protein [Mesorhizobium sp. M0715]|uniref:hypothetical protein n=1 Tax=Mesorhizobium sp. M0715 TaxID=2956990 RepID=UPI003335B28A
MSGELRNCPPALHQVEAIVGRYGSGSRGDKRLILDEFVAVTGYHRKHAIRALCHRASKTPGNKRYRLRYGGDVREALVVLWKASERLCSKRLRPLIPVLLPALERHGRLELDAALRGKLLTMSPDGFWRGTCCGSRRPASASRNEFGGSPIGAGAHLRDWNDPPPGYVEVDFVAHSGTALCKRWC